jgi:transcriptional regulator with XRE-family HTH domain
MIPEAFAQYRIGAKLKSLREEIGYSLARLSSATGIDDKDLKGFEDGDKLPGLHELATLANALQVDLGHFFVVTSSEHPAEVVRSNDRWIVKPQTSAARTLNFRYQALSYQLTERLMSPFLIEIPPNKGFDVEPSAHPGEEFLFVLSGHIEARVAGEIHHLSRGDSIYFGSSANHSLRAESSHPARVLACFAMVRRPYQKDPLDRAFDRLD